MPCHDGREAEWAELERRQRDAMTALLCGVMNHDPKAIDLADRWATHHRRVDTLRKSVRYDWQNEDISRELAACDRILEAAHKALCVPA
jgi:hypothetical protein